MSPTTTPKRSPKRGTRRSPLQERTPSQKNEQATRLHRDSRQDLTNLDFFAATPLPTKPQHVLRPSTIRKQKSRHNIENELPTLFAQAREASGSTLSLSGRGREDARQGRRAPNLQLKQSVHALRDMYEAQAERSRPSTAAPSPALRPSRPSTAGSKMRSRSSSEAFYGRNPWEMLGLPKVSEDDLAMLPALSGDFTHRFGPDTSFAERMYISNQTSSPDFGVYALSSPATQIHNDSGSSDPVTEPIMDESTLNLQGESSPNVVQLGFDTSIMTDPTPTSFLGSDEVESSPNIVKLATTSPRRSSSPTASLASNDSRKRKREDRAPHAGHTPIFGARKTRQPTPDQVYTTTSQASSQVRVLPSSPPEIESIHSRSRSVSGSSAVIRMPVRRANSDSSSLGNAHANLQSVISSSPGPIIQYPVVKAPRADQFQGMTLQKQRKLEAPALRRIQAGGRLSPVPSEAEPAVHALSAGDHDRWRSGSRASIYTEDLDDVLVSSPSVVLAKEYILQHDLNSSQAQMISEADRHEAVDELSALPKSRGSFLPSNLIPTRGSSYIDSYSNSSSQSRLNSVRNSFDRMRSHSRPGSSASQMSNLAVPTWARKYYSGVFRDSFQYLYQSTNNLPVTHIQPLRRAQSQHMTMASSSRSRSTKLSLQSVRSSFKNFTSIILPSGQNRLTVRNSHFSPGVGPLVSNPVRPQSMQYPPTIYRSQGSSIRRVSMPLSAHDPRSHWNGIAYEDSYTTIPSVTTKDLSYASHHRNYSNFRPFQQYRGNPRYSSPHLHHDRHIETASSTSRGFGYPYNNHQSTFDIFGPPQSASSTIDLRDAQVILFVLGFILPISWFTAAVLPLPTRPQSYHDIEKAEWDIRSGTMTVSQMMHNAGGSRASCDWDEMDVVARLRLERHLRGIEEMRWQNARWWRRMNRFMSCVGVVVVIVVIVLAVIGTKARWSN